MGGGGLPQGRVTLRQPRAGGPLSGVADFAPYTAGGQRLALAPIRFGPGPGRVDRAQHRGAARRAVPERTGAGRCGFRSRGGSARGGSFAFGTACAVVSFNYLQMSTLQLGPTRLPVCPIGPAMIYKREGGPVIASARLNGPVLNGRLGSSPFHLAAASGQITGKQFTFNSLGNAARAGEIADPVRCGAADRELRGLEPARQLQRRARRQIGKVPLLLSDAAAAGCIAASNAQRERRADGVRPPTRTRASIRCDSNDVHLHHRGDYIRATGSLHHPATGTLVTNVSIEHRLSTGAGHATLDVPGIAFGPNLQPEQLTRLTEGVVALVNGTVTGQGRINWAAGGKVTSTGDFSTANMDLAAPFGPVTGLSTTMHFTDLLGARDRAAPGRDGRLDQPRHHGRERSDHTTSCCPTIW